MKTALVFALGLMLALSLSLVAQEAKPDRVSGTVRSVDAKAMSIEVNLSQTPTAVRVVLWDDKTKVQLGSNPGTAADIKEGMRIVAIGKFEGVKLRATSIRVRPR